MTVTLSPHANGADPQGRRTAATAARRSAATEDRILAATLRLVGRRGVKRLGMQEVSEAAGVSRATLYRYFPSKDRLMDAVAIFDERTFSEGLAHSLAVVEDPSDRIRIFVAFAFDYIRTHPARAVVRDASPSSSWAICWLTCRNCKKLSWPSSATRSTPPLPSPRAASAASSWSTSSSGSSRRASSFPSPTTARWSSR